MRFCHSFSWVLLKSRMNITLKSKNGNILHGLVLTYFFFAWGVGDSYSFNHTSPCRFDIKGLPAGPNNRPHLFSLSGFQGLWAMAFAKSVPCLLLKVMMC